MAIDQASLKNWELRPLMSAKMRISLVSWIVSTETDPRVGGASPPGTFPKEGPDSVAPVVIPALAPTLDKSVKGDRSSCLVRACVTTWTGPQTEQGVGLCLLQERL